MNINEVFLVGNLTRDADIRQSKDGSDYATFTVAVNDRVKRGDEWTDSPNFIDCVWFRANKLVESLVKGVKVALIGKLHQSSWQKDGQRHSKLEVWVSAIDPMKPKEKQLSDDDLPF